MADHHDGGYNKLEDAIAYAKHGQEDVNVMQDPKTQRYHVIRLFGVEHWSQHYTTVAEVRVRMDVRMVE